MKRGRLDAAAAAAGSAPVARIALLLPSLLLAMLLPAARLARAENHVTIRGQYYRETSTRVIQPVAEIAQDLPHGLDVSTHYLLDAITSASAASGPTGDNIFTEYRNEVGLAAGKSWSRLRLGAFYRYSAESDYWSHTFGASATIRLWQDTATLALSAGMGFDQVGRRVQGAAPTPAPGASCTPSGMRTCPLETRFAGIGYSQVLSPTSLVQVGYEVAFLTGFLASPYRMVPGLGFENVPDSRRRNAVSGRAAKYFPGTGTGVQLHYRYYWDFYPGANLTTGVDPWRVRTHTVELRLFQSLGRDVELRLSGRYYPQGAATFWCDAGLGPSCAEGMRLSNRPDAALSVADPKLGPVSTAYLEGKVYWEATALRDVAVLGWFSAGTFELSYGYLWQSTQFGGAHVLQTGYTLPY